MTEHLMSTYARLPVAFARGEGAWLWDNEGNAYLDALSGIAVCGLGHAHPEVTEAITRQAARLLHTSNLYRVPLQEELAERLCGVTGMDSAFFCNSGAEANETAIKLARLHGHRRDVSNPQIVVAEGAFHGRTIATLTATGSRRVQAGFEPLAPGFVRAPWADADALAEVARRRNDIVAVLVEPVQGESGIRIPPRGYLADLRRLCDERGWLLMMDEVQSGNGRTGRWLASQYEDAMPDVVTLAKGLANGVPIGACLARGPVAEEFRPGNHGSTFGGNPLASAAALAVLRTIERDRLLARAKELGERIAGGLGRALEGLDAVREIRHRGLMLALELDRPCGELVQRALDERLLINVTAERVVRLLPPLVLGDADADQLVDRLARVIRGFVGQQ
ncbi:MAG TPA: aspartate aminotransferase family protein [Gammaproteobacteria bacterium]|nr:aspartate aminotransferase family protein [Gammaproteobacteria bacterium]